MSLSSITPHFFTRGVRTYAVIDGARCTGISQRLSASQTAWRCLYSGVAAITLKEHAPYLVELTATNPLTRWLLEEEWGNALGILIQSEDTLERVRIVMKKKLFVRNAQGERLYFRFYDPRVLRSFLASGASEHLAWLMEPPVRVVLFETREGNMVRCAVRPGAGVANLAGRAAGLPQVDITRVDLRRPPRPGPSPV